MTIYKQGSSGPGVIALQKALIAKGYDLGAADGIFGAKTVAAVRTFQTAAGLTVDGAVGPVTAAAL
ncbi:MAG TPA: peptidoglycan-binding domain-containing protein, partial [Azospirillaceae bacterium]|nr:peptidoglycan-binding domain-containing protein [Azospirillaceae bacterium]